MDMKLRWHSDENAKNNELAYCIVILKRFEIESVNNNFVNIVRHQNNI